MARSGVEGSESSLKGENLCISLIFFILDSALFELICTYVVVRNGVLIINCDFSI